MKLTSTFFLVLNSLFLLGQTIADFENFTLNDGGFLNGSDGNGGFESGSIFLPNNYDEAFDSWIGWAISNSTDTLTPGFQNQYSAITGMGVNNSSNYAVAFVLGENTIQLKEQIREEGINGMYITNSTYAYLSMLEGDAFAKKFGGATGNDPDFFLLTIRKYLEGILSEESIEFYLADFRFEDNTQDYIINEWTYVDLSSLGAADSLSFTLSSSDIGQFGINTPTYFCIDNVEALNATITAVPQHLVQEIPFQVYPNPSTDFIVIEQPSQRQQTCHYTLYDTQGNNLQKGVFNEKQKILNIQNLPESIYILSIQIENKIWTQKIVH